MPNPFGLSVRPRTDGPALRAENRTGDLHMEITIRENAGVVTLINVFTVEPGDQEKLLQMLKESTETVFSKLPGYVSASFHKSRDGRRIVNYGQWRSPQDIEAFRSNPEIGAYFGRIKALAQFEAIVCDASYVDRA
jgi:quinol monooxygenase YgiN